MSTRATQFHVSVAAHSDVGLVRQNNEDVWHVIPELWTYILADGMGGHQAGEVAAREAVESLTNSLLRGLPEADRSTLDKAIEVLQDGIEEANDHVYQLSRSYPEFKGMGTTLCCLHFHPDGIVYGHVGDSRIYRYRDGVLEQLTRDHSLLREMMDKGQLREDDATDFAYKNIITRAIGADQEVIPCLEKDSLQEGDLFLLCSDGLSDLLDRQTLEQIFNESASLSTLSQDLISQANACGGNDNITVVLIKMETSSPVTI